ncbi:MAG: patatin-like phospholipase family protein [Halioglobus sp.]|nr:patatin-like phospholipase family protein [Halioglobus sp.]
MCKSGRLHASYPERSGILQATLHQLTLVLVLALAGCSTILPPDNKAITRIGENASYPPIKRAQQSEGDTLVLLAFSGGGTRAAALSYGVMQELRDTLIQSNGETVRLLDEVDTISSVSGGSFTAAYYGLYRDRLFEDYEKDFLRQGVQQALITQLFNPMHWIRSGFYGFNRTEMAIDYYNRIMFDGATFADMAKNGPPYIVINATDLGNGLRFSFSRAMFDLICTDLGSYPVARAVTASSAVPVAFPPVVLTNHASECEVDAQQEWQMLQELAPDTAVQRRIVDGLKSYRDSQNRKYIHLVDGGVADNLGLRVMIDRVESLNAQRLHALAHEHPGSILVILVNAEVSPERLIEKSYGTPSLSVTMDAVTSAQFESYNRETLDRFRDMMTALSEASAEDGLPTRTYFSQVSFKHIKSTEINRMLNALPTALELDDIDVDRLILAGRLILRNEPAFQAFKQEHHASLAEGAITEEALCRYFDHPTCSGTHRPGSQGR